MRHLRPHQGKRAERRAAPKPARIPSGDRPTYPSDEGLSAACPGLPLVLHGGSGIPLADRRALLKAFDSFRREADTSGAMAGLDEFESQAFDILTSSRLLKALDVSSEPEKIRAMYGKGTDSIQGDAAPRLNQQFLLARRLVEAGVRVVTLSYSFWDWHGENFSHAKKNLPDFDEALSALVQDLHDRGMQDDVTVLAWGEFGRSPRINPGGGRDQWPKVSCALMAGGGMKTGQVIGATDRLGGEAWQRRRARRPERPAHRAPVSWRAEIGRAHV